MHKVRFKDGRQLEVSPDEVQTHAATFTNPCACEVNCATGEHVYRELSDQETVHLEADRAKWAQEEAARDQAEAAAKAQRDADMAAVKAKAATDPAFAALARLLEK